MAESSVSAAKTVGDLNQDGEQVVVLPFLNFFRPVREDIDNADAASIEDDFDLSEEENYLLSYYPNEFDFYDQKRGQIVRRNGERKKLSDGVKAKTNCPRNVKVELPSSKAICKRVVDSEIGLSNKESRIKDTRIENARRKKENKTKAKKGNRITVVQSASERKPFSSCLRKSVKRPSQEVNQATDPLTYYNNSDFVIGSGDSTVKFEDQSYINLLIELQNREITPEDYDLLSQLDCSVAPKTLSKATIDSLQSDNVTSASDDICSICIEDYVPGDIRKFLPCGHHFHGHCITTWLSTTSDRCPIDGKEVR
ncbi:uncharacterized protein LOC144665213 [Oculina patagonica]